MMEKKVEIVLVGTHHFAYQKDVLMDKQNEIIELVDFLAAFNPGKIALEWEKSEQEELDKGFTKSEEDYEMHEIEQVGFRLATKLDRKAVFAVNWAGPLTQEEMVTLNQSIQEDYPNIWQAVEAFGKKSGGINPDQTLLEAYRKLNNPELTKDLEEMYLSFLAVEKNGQNIGVSFLSKWMERELTIVKNISEILEKPKERILLIVGGDHLWMLKKLFEGKGWTVINPFEK
ncbi:DUF5694 domain-containing protein [Planococcus halocryophilus]|uniref:TraB/GumN family protein n=1 Tax=Planococcus halocryophilus TaxID=1215089 RepID=A0A1C7DPC0_9BACL|nr:DUF5694 domain-containing protein [Planococcus halocryophilus]ANU13326.1 hypothetical protein BBI08_05515 [Planococcus halocryophilus]